MEITFNVRYPNTVPTDHATVLQFHSKELTYTDLNSMISYCLNTKILPSTQIIDRGGKITFFVNFFSVYIVISCYCL